MFVRYLYLIGLFILLLNMSGSAQGQICEDHTLYTQRVTMLRPPNLEYVLQSASVGDMLYQVICDHDFDYQLLAIDTSDQSNPQYRGTLTFQKYTRDMIGGENTLYVATGDSIQIVEVSDPDSLRILGGIPIVNGISDLKLQGNLLYIAYESFGIAIIDVSDPVNPVQIGDKAVLGVCRGMDLHGDYAYVLTNSNSYISRLEIVDVSDPTNPVIMNYIETYDSNEEIMIDGDYAYLAVELESPVYWDRSLLQVLSLNDPLNPVIVGLTWVDFGIDVMTDIIKDGDYLFMSSGSVWSEIAVIEVGNPSAPTVTRYEYFENAASYMAIGGGCLLASTEYMPVLFRLGLNSAPPVVSSLDLDTSGSFTNDDALLYFVDREFGLRIYDMSDLSSPLLLGELESSGGGPTYELLRTDVELHGDHAYFCNSDTDLKIVEISDPSEPEYLPNTLSLDGNIRHFGIWENIVYLVNGESELQMVDISAPENPIALPAYTMADEANDIVIADGILYASGKWSGHLCIYSLATPDDPVLLGEFTGASGDLYYQNGVVYLNHMRLSIVDVSDPTTPTLLSSTSYHYGEMTAIDGLSMELIWPYAYIARFNLGIEIYDVTDPTSPVFTGYLNPGVDAREIERFGSMLGIGDGGFKLFAPQCSGLIEAGIDLPTNNRMQLLQCFPNPFNPHTTISFSTGRRQAAEIAVYDLTGRLVRRLWSGQAETTVRSVDWDGRDDSGRQLPSGAYFVRLKGDVAHEVQKVMLLR
jgi:hypothetical protein